jgi:hypothetical protein
MFASDIMFIIMLIQESIDKLKLLPINEEPIHHQLRCHPKAPHQQLALQGGFPVLEDQKVQGPEP